PKPAALLITPIAPATAGNGLAMRAGLILEALRRDHTVQVWRVPAAGGGPGDSAEIVAPLEVDPAWTLANRAGLEARRQLGRPELCRFATHRAVGELRRSIGRPAFRVTVVLRSYLLPFARPVDRAGGTLGLRVVDLDDDEEATRRRLANLLRAAGDVQGAQREALEAELFKAHEAASLPWAHRLLSAQADHVERLRARYPESQVGVLPNAIDTAAWSRADRDGSQPVDGRPARLLLVGNLGYLPNQAAARELAGEILPVLRAKGLDAEARLVGRQPSRAVRELDRLVGVTVWPDVPDLRPHYAWADQVLLPLRAGGGTRIKILEAFAAGVPVISTPLGAEGLAVVAGEHLLLAESVDELAASALRLAREPDLADRLARQARRWVRRHHDRRSVADRLADQLAGGIPAGTGRR
ncbi:MAG: glycosyltransferase family 4 protein, partial [Acidobacteriota bacterium]